MKRAILCILIALGASSASAQSLRTWLDGAGGDDVNPCSRTAPCKTFAGAIAKTATNGEINLITPTSAGTVTITKSITIDGGETKGGVLFALASGMTINGDDINVVIRNIDLEGTANGIRGFQIITAASVVIENCTISNYTSEGIRDARNSGKLFVRNSTFIGGQYGVLLTSSAVTAVLENVSIRNATVAGARASGSSGKLHIVDSVFGGNATGLLVDNASAVVERSSFTFNTTGVDAATGGTIRLSECIISENTTGVAITGTVSSFGNNRIAGNTGGNGAGMALVLEQ